LRGLEPAGAAYPCEPGSTNVAAASEQEQPWSNWRRTDRSVRTRAWATSWLSVLPLTRGSSAARRRVSRQPSEEARA
jgi:hypothetical protein